MTKYIGAHVSASGGVGNAILNAEAIGANAFALFTRNQRSWVSKPLAQMEIDGFKALLADRGFSPKYVLPHDSYLINLGIKTAYIHSDVATLDRVKILSDLRQGVYDVLVGVNLLREGLDLP